MVDESRVVRATLCKHLKDEFEIREEADGESAWQTLMLDASLSVIISGVHIPRLSAHDLLARLKASSMRRLREIPFVLITTDVDNKAKREYDRSRGVDGFISKSMDRAELLKYLDNLLDSAVYTESVILPDAPAEETEAEPGPVPEVEPEHMQPTLEPIFKAPAILDPEPFGTWVASLAVPNPKAGKLSMLVFAIDNRDSLIASFGQEAMDMVVKRIASLLITKVGPSDSIGRCGDDRLCIISRGVDLDQGMHFARRVCASLSAGQITIRGQKIRLTASVGVASNTSDPVSDGASLFALAEKRLTQALVCGGNTVASDSKMGCPLRRSDLSASGFLDAINLQDEKTMAAQIGALGLKVLPLLAVMDRELALNLPLADIKRQLEQRNEIKKS